MKGKMKYPSVTEVLSKYQDFSQIPPERLEAACERGSAVHAFCAAYANGLWTPKPLEAEGYCQSFTKWFDKYVQDTFTVEQEFIDDTYGFVGHSDWTGLLIGDEWPIVIDWKTPITLQPVWEAQIAAYMHLANCKRGASLRLSPNGKMPRFKEYTENKRAFQAFLNALTAHKYFS